ncbi:MAG TPA: hypothetical protein VEO56_00740, partial [Bacteroidota bacterium]|nr:hypothetical protein [Bacteroidota bacterium]
MLLLLAAGIARGEADSLSRPLAFHGLPYVYYTPETDWAFGASGIVTFRTGSEGPMNPSSLLLDGFYTVKRQYKFTVIPEIYFDRDLFLFTGDFEYGRIVDKYWGIGPRTSDSDSTQYVKGTYKLQALVQAIVSGRL